MAAIGELHADVDWLAITTELQRDGASGRNFVDHPSELFHALHWLAIELQDHVVLLDPGFAGRSILIYQRDLRAALFFELERRHAIGGHIAGVNSQIGPTHNVHYADATR